MSKGRRRWPPHCLGLAAGLALIFGVAVARGQPAQPEPDMVAVEGFACEGKSSELFRMNLQLLPDGEAPPLESGPGKLEGLRAGRDGTVKTTGTDSQRRYGGDVEIGSSRFLLSEVKMSFVKRGKRKDDVIAIRAKLQAEPEVQAPSQPARKPTTAAAGRLSGHVVARLMPTEARERVTVPFFHGRVRFAAGKVWRVAGRLATATVVVEPGEAEEGQAGLSEGGVGPPSPSALREVQGERNPGQPEQREGGVGRAAVPAPAREPGKLQPPVETGPVKALPPSGSALAGKAPPGRPPGPPSPAARTPSRAPGQ